MKLSEMSSRNSKHTSQKHKNLEETYDELKNCSSDELMQRLVKEIQTQKDGGVFDYDGLINAIEKIKIYLPTATYENMIRIVESLK